MVIDIATSEEGQRVDCVIYLQVLRFIFFPSKATRSIDYVYNNIILYREKGRETDALTKYQI